MNKPKIMSARTILALVTSCTISLAAGCNSTEQELDANLTRDVRPSSDMDSLFDSGSKPEATRADQGSDTDPTTCNLGLPTWTGTQYQGPDDALMEFANQAEQIVVKIARLYDGGGIGESSIFSLGGFYLKRKQETICVLTDENLDYTNAHHNWYDQATATAGSTRYLLDMQYDAMGSVIDWTYEITANDGAVRLWGPIALKLTSGPTWN